VRRNPHLGLWLAGIAAALVLVLVLGPMVPAPAGPSGVRSSVEGAASVPAASDFSASVTFQGTAVANHTTTGTAIPTSFGGNFLTVFNWQSPGQPTLVDKGEVIVLFLGAAVGTSSSSIQGAQPAGSGTINLSSDFSQDKYLFEGVYQVQASLFDRATAIWNTTFYVWVQAPDHFTVINIALILIGIYEIYQIAALGSVRVARKELGLVPPPKQGGT